MEIFGEKVKLYLGRESRFYGLKENKGESRHIFKRSFRSEIVMEMKNRFSCKYASTHVSHKI